MKRIHIVNGISAAGLLKHTLKESDRDKDQSVYCLEDDLSTGPLYTVESETGIENRANYIEKITKKIGSNYPLREHLDLHCFINFDFSVFEEVIIWHGKNTPEKLLKLLCCKIINSSRLFEVDISKTRYKNGDTPWAVAQCDPITISTLLKTKEKISNSDCARSKEQWTELTATKNNLRIYKNDTVINRSEDFFDNDILENCPNEYTPALKVIGNLLGRSEQLITDSFVTYRLLSLIDENKITQLKNSNNIRELMVKR